MADAYVLTAADLPAVRALLRFQGQLAAGIQAMTPDRFCSEVPPLLEAYPALRNAQVKAWFDGTFAHLHATPTIGGKPFPVLQMLWDYQHFCRRQLVLAWRYNPTGSLWQSFWYAFVNGNLVLFDGVGGLVTDPPPRIVDPHPTIGPYVLPPLESWKGDDQAAITAWGEAPPAALVANENHMFKVTVCLPKIDGSCYYYEENAVDGLPLVGEQSRIIAGWSNAAKVAGEVAAAQIAAQGDCFASLMKVPELTGDDYLFALHLIIGLLTGTSSQSTQARTLVSALCTSPEYPNDTFINQLVYSALLTLGDPIGSWGFANADLLAFVNTLEGTISATDPGSAAVKQSLVDHGKVLKADSAYPLQDPYTSIGFTQRKTDTLFALDATRRQPTSG